MDKSQYSILSYLINIKYDIQNKREKNNNNNNIIELMVPFTDYCCCYVVCWQKVFFLLSLLFKYRANTWNWTARKYHQNIIIELIDWFQCARIDCFYQVEILFKIGSHFLTLCCPIASVFYTSNMGILFPFSQT